ncbi:MFS general substrate transporter [Guyanagaster necrorhizus]|uniref:MFS general substrate transporter n=1 Tax=Guyanagaster necrorhizus TaxID=856835 RepID=A0A9P7W281_9AGAR|nr:MFS general substrate transporter [Guyanagaster necrorhizus MCA 3950]KAG7450645.1 MFS general substrate transporter [Guyanagaster necrorhizus MCA 3950]
MNTRASSFDDTRTLQPDQQLPDVVETIQVQPSEKNGADPFLVTLDPSEDPQYWSVTHKWSVTILGGVLLLNATFASSAPSGIVEQVIEEFGLSTEVATLMISLFVAGYCVGPIIWGPLSEEFGRRPIFIVAFIVYVCFQIGMALAKNTASLLVFRFIGGTFAACPLTNSGAIISDIWDARTRGKALAIFTVAPFAGPALGPTVAGYISVAGVSWRWVFWVLTIFAGICWILIIVAIPETYRPILLVKKAKKMRKETGDDRYYAPMEKDTKTLAQQVEHVLARPFKILFQEPMLMASTLYLSFVYGCLYLLFEAYPIVFTEGHGFNAGVSGLMFLPIMFGGITAVIGYLLIWNPRYEKEVARCAPGPVAPEYRLHMALFASPLFAVSFFWFGWTSFPSISYWAPLMAGYVMGFSISWIFLSFFNYIIDTYLMIAASALAANTVCRSLFGAAFPLFATQMYTALDPRWASSLLGFVALAMVPLPLLFLKYGHILRMKSKYALTKKLPVSCSKESDKTAA